MQQLRMRRKEYLQILVDWQLDNQGTEELSKTWYLPINLLYVITQNVRLSLNTIASVLEEKCYNSVMTCVIT